MKTILYNTDTQQLEANGRVFDGGYKIRSVAQKPFLPAHIKELEYIDATPPTFDAATHKIGGFEWVADLNAETYTKVWNVVALSAKELAAIEWEHPEWGKRLDVHGSVLFTQMGTAYRNYLNDKGYAVEMQADGNYKVWIDTIEPSHQPYIDGLVNANLCTIHERPQILD